MRFFKQLLAAALLLLSTQVFAEIQAGRDYTELSPPQPVHSGDKVEVLEFFFYGCSHCFHLHPQISAWEKKKPKDVDFQYVPAIFRDSWEAMARTFYALDAMGQQQRLHDELFNAWNLSNMVMTDESSTLDFLSSRGIDRAKFSAAYNSFSVNSKVAQANQMVRDYRIHGTPTLIVDGKYSISGLTPEATIQVLNEVIAKARKERSKRK